MLLYILVFIGLFIVATAAYAGFRAAPWLPTRAKDFQRILDLVNIKPGATIYEFGAGDGRLCNFFAHTEASRIEGFEISLIPYCIGLLRTIKNRSKVKMRFRDFFRVSSTPADVIFCFLTPPAMKKLGEKFLAECKPGTQIVSYAFPIPQLTAHKISKEKPSDISIFSYIL
jgi:tRNA A58 N-methylase Trm61